MRALTRMLDLRLSVCRSEERALLDRVKLRPREPVAEARRRSLPPLLSTTASASRDILCWPPKRGPVSQLSLSLSQEESQNPSCSKRVSRTCLLGVLHKMSAPTLRLGEFPSLPTQETEKRFRSTIIKTLGIVFTKEET